MRIGFIGDSLTQGIPGSAFFPRLERFLPEHTLVNLGRAGDTASSLLGRIATLPQRDHFDLAFLWVGVNDIVSRRDLFLRIVTTPTGQCAARHRHAFERDYVQAVEVVQASATRVVLVSPLFKGEDPQGELNRRLGEMAEFMARVAAEREGVTFLDLRTETMAKLQGRRAARFRSRPPRVLWDIATARSDATIDRRSERRGYTLSIDGLHLNSRHADWVAQQFLAEIKRQLA